MTLILSIVLNTIEINYACVDQHIDAKFKTYKEANKYAEYYKPHHSYVIIPFVTFKKNGKN
jgi:hypothetical protein|tara:strand:+ start:404 stop:586 length:183 start_codon:yes stop_codon:yes gene_type:complete